MVNNSYLYVSAPQVGGQSMVDAWAFDLGSGALTTSPGFTLGALSEPAGMAVDPAGPYLYIADAGGVDGLQVGATGGLSAIAGSPFRSAGGGLFLAIDPQNRYVFTSVDQPNGYVSAATIDASTGALTVVGGSPFAIAPGGSTDTRPFEIAVDSTGSYVYTTLEGTNQVAGFSIGTGGVLTQLPGSPYAAGNTPFTLATANNLLYVSNAMDGTISGYSITASTGVLVPLSGSPFAIHASAMTIDPNARFLFASGTGGEIQVFNIEATSGALTPVTGSPGSPATVFEYVQ
jgi:6-phosphogluconolactonase (cycloisomerase 2 family)